MISERKVKTAAQFQISKETNTTFAVAAEGFPSGGRGDSCAATRAAAARGLGPPSRGGAVGGVGVGADNPIVPVPVAEPPPIDDIGPAAGGPGALLPLLPAPPCFTLSSAEVGEACEGPAEETAPCAAFFIRSLRALRLRPSRRLLPSGPRELLRRADGLDGELARQACVLYELSVYMRRGWSRKRHGERRGDSTHIHG